MTTSLLFIRHAQSVWNADGRWQGQANPPLSETGRRQAKLLAQRLQTWKIERLYCSDLERAKETATIVGRALDLVPVIDPAWRERGIGALEGLTAEEIEARFPDIWAKRFDGPMDAIPGAESSADLFDRVGRACASLLAQHEGETIAVVSHGGTILASLSHLLGLAHNGYTQLVGGDHTAIHRVNVRDGRARLTLLNDSAHLELLAVQAHIL